MDLIGTGPNNADNGGFDNSRYDGTDMISHTSDNDLRVYEILHQTKWFSRNNTLGLRPLPIRPACVIPSLDAARMIALEYYRDYITLYAKHPPVWYEGVDDNGHRYFQTSFPMGDIEDTNGLREVVRIVERRIFYSNNQLKLE
jgi:hypothetical protein